jgi:hypothetical protein
MHIWMSVFTCITLSTVYEKSFVKIYPESGPGSKAVFGGEVR